MKELKERFIAAWLYGGWIFKVLLIIALVAFIFSTIYIDLSFPEPAWISTVIYIFAGSGAALYLYPESW